MVLVNTQYVDNRTSWIFETLQASTNEPIRSVFNDGYVTEDEFGTLLDPNSDNHTNYTDLILLNNQLPEGYRLRWGDLVHLYEVFPGATTLDDQLDQTELKGTIKLLPQHHYSKNTSQEYRISLQRPDAQDQAIPRRESKDYETSFAKTTQMQTKIYEYLKVHNARYIFPEGQESIFIVHPDVDDNDSLCLSSKLCKTFGEYKKVLFTSENIRYTSTGEKIDSFLNLLGGALKYAVEKRDVILFPVTTKEMNGYCDLLNQQLHEIWLITLEPADTHNAAFWANKEAEVKEILKELEATNSIREKDMVRAAEEFLAENPGESVYLILGSKHSLEHYFFGPHLSFERVSF